MNEAQQDELLKIGYDLVGLRLRLFAMLDAKAPVKEAYLHLVDAELALTKLVGVLS